MPKYHHAAANGNIVDEMMDALRPFVSPEVLAESEVAATITTPAGTQVISQAEARSAIALTDLQRMADQLADLKRRLEMAMDAVATACNAYHCMECGEWTVKSIPYGEASFARDARRPMLIALSEGGHNDT